MRRRLFVALLALLCCGGLLPAQRAVEFEGRYWMPAARSRVSIKGAGTDIRFKEDLGLQDANFPEGRLSYYGRGRSHIHFSYTPIDYAGETTINRTLVFGGRQYTVGARVLSEFEIQHLQLGWAWQFLNIREGAFKLGPVLAGQGFLFRGRLRAPDLQPAVDQEEELMGGLPTVGLAMDINPHRRVNLFADVSGIKLGKYGYFVTSDAGVKIMPARVGFFTVGYRNFNLDLKNEPDFARVILRGVFVGGGARF